MRKHPHSFALGALGVLLLLYACAPGQGTISGRVVDEEGTPLPGAVVRVKATEKEAISDAAGNFTLADLAPGEPVFVTAWVAGYFINGVDGVKPGTQNVEIMLHGHAIDDNPEYAWLPSTDHPGEGENQGCAECHSSVGSELVFPLPVDEWLLDAHSQSATNIRFTTMYNGTDVYNNQSPATRYAFNRDYGQIPLRPDPDQPYYGPGYKLDFPQTDGNCAACHTPAASVNDPYGIDPTNVDGVAAEGVPCDLCHKVWDVRLSPDSGLPYPNMPGVLSLEFRRPPEGHQFFAGPLDDVAPGEDTYVPIQRESQICAACHFGVFWDTVVYNSFGEWLASPYSDPVGGQTCQDCHMPPVVVTHFALPDQGGVGRDPQTIFSHRMPGALDENLLQNAVTMGVEATRENTQVAVTMSLTNDLTGHHVPTDSPMRHLILLVSVQDDQGQPLPQVEGQIIPDWCGIGDPAEGYYAGEPGKAYAKVLMELWTEIAPSAAYWNPTRVVSDNRLAAYETDITQFTFETADPGAVTVRVRLLYRRAFINLMDQKGWDVPDILMESVDLIVP